MSEHAVSLMLLVFTAHTASAQDLESRAYTFDPWVETPAMAVGAMFVMTTYLLQEDLVAPGCGRCDRRSINSLDRGVSRSFELNLANVGDATVSSVIGLGLGAVVFDHLLEPTAGWEAWATETLILTETLVLSASLMQAVKLIVQRPRPYTYNPQVPASLRDSPDSSLSFYSGHTSNSFAIAVCFASIFHTRHPDSIWFWPIAAGGLGLATLTGVMMVQAGYHFWSDVLVGSAVGIATGLLVPALHEKESLPSPVAIVPLVSAEGVGLGLTGRW